MMDVQPDPSHPFYDWICFYGDRTDSITTKFCARLDEWAETAGKAEKEKMKELFCKAVSLNTAFGRWLIQLKIGLWKWRR